MNIETQIKLDKFIPREYQLPICDAMENKKFRKILYVLPRRAGKDIIAWNLMIRAAIKEVGNYFYCLPTFKQARMVIFDSITNDGQRFLDFLPKPLIASINQQEMKIRLINGSIIQLTGSDSYDTSLIGSNAKMIVFSEYGTSDSRAYTLAARPILNANGGTVIILGTPRGKNHFYEMYQIAKNSDDWFCYFKTLDDTQHIDADEIKREIASGEISEDLALQEYWCSFELGVEGAYYAKYIDKLRLNERIGDVAWEPQFKVHTAWDIGWNDSTCIIFYQVVGTMVRIIDCYEANFKPIDHYCKVVLSKPYIYGKHFVGHDIMVHEQGSGLTRYDMYKNLGVKFEQRDGKSAIPNVSIEDGIEAVRALFARLWVDDKNGKQLIKCLENYHQEFDNKRKVYKGIPLHDWSSHMADAMRYLALTVNKVQAGSTQEDWDKHYQNARMGNNANMPAVFRTDLPKY